jgi:hypothetical protein
MMELVGVAPFEAEVQDRVCAPKDNYACGVVWGRKGDLRWVMFDGEEWPTTFHVEDLAPEMKQASAIAG